MALRQAEQSQLESINQTVTILASMDLEQSQIEEKMKDMIVPLEKSANCQLVFKKDENGARFDVIELKSDFVRTRQNPDKTMTSLRAKIYGLPIEVKVKKDTEEFSNAQVAKSLLELATLVGEMPVEMLINANHNWSRTPGEMPKSVAAGTDEDENIDENAIPESGVTALSGQTVPEEKTSTSTELPPAPQVESEIPAQSPEQVETLVNTSSDDIPEQTQAETLEGQPLI
jgi:hypothetical protein